MDSLEVQQLVARAQAKDQAAFAELYDMYASNLYRFIRFKVPRIEEAEDLLQDTFFKAWQALPRLKLTELYFRAWLYKIARNVVNDYYRKAYRAPLPADIADYPELADSTNAAELGARALELERVRVALTNLKPEYRQVIELRFLQAFSVEETAKIMGKTSLAIRLIQHRATKQLRARLSIEQPHASVQISE